MQQDMTEIEIIKLRLEYLKKMAKCWEEHASIQEVAALICTGRYESVAGNDNFINTLQKYYQAANDAEWVIF